MNLGFLGAALARAVASSAGKKAPAAKGTASPGKSALTYSESGPSGYIHYSTDGKKFSMYFEFGGGNALVTISVPPADTWEAKTGLPLAQRDEVLNSVARQVIADKTSTGKNRYEISENWITIFEV